MLRTGAAALSRRRERVAAALSLAVLFLLHHDVWLWDAPHRLAWAAGLPAGFVYHVAYCFAAAALMAVLVRRFLPSTSTSTWAADDPPR